MKLLNVVALFSLLGCSSAENCFTVEYNCVDELPKSAIGLYSLRKMVNGDEITLPRTTMGWLRLYDDQKFLLKLTHYKVKSEITGYYDVNSGFLFVYTDSTFEDILLVYQYRYTPRAIILETFDKRLGIRITMYWRMISTSRNS